MHPDSHQDADSYYAASSNGPVDAPALASDQDTEVVVIGGGLTGSSTALHLAEKGVDVVQLEARHFGWGASGRSGGQIVNGYSLEQNELEKLVGLERAQRLWQHSINAVTHTESLIQRLQIQCDYRRGYLHVAVKPKQAVALQQWVRHLAAVYGYDAMAYHDRRQLGELLGSTLYSGGAFDPGGGHLHPLNYTVGVARAAQQAGAKLYRKSPAVRVQPHADGYRVVCDNGVIQCRQVVYACNAYLDRLAPAIDNKIMPVGTYIIATEPLSDEQADSVIRSRVAVADTNFVLDYYRLSADRRMLFGGRVSYSAHPPRNLAESLRRRMLRVFPQLGEVKVDYCWGGCVAITRNRAPHIGQQADGSWFAHGYSGHGMALSGYIGKLLADAVRGQADDLDDFRAIRHRAFPGGRLLRTPLLVAGMSYYRWRDNL